MNVNENFESSPSISPDSILASHISLHTVWPDVVIHLTLLFIVYSVFSVYRRAKNGYY